MGSNQTREGFIKTHILKVNTEDLGTFKDKATLEEWELPANGTNLVPLREAAKYLKTSSMPIGFPTETVYGLGADATRSDAVKGIYKAKGRPSDNPLIIHICDLTMLRNYLAPAAESAIETQSEEDPIPEIYRPLIKKFWPGPLTILLPNPRPSRLAPEVTAGLSTFGARMPELPLALSLIKLAGVPLAAPSANASTKPSPTTADHVRHDLDGKIQLILDGGSCQVGVESTVVDGLCDPPVLLRPGGLSIDKIREVPGWENVVKGYQDQSEIGSSAPRAPGMKYKHYSPRASVILFEASSEREPLTGLTLETRRAILSGKAPGELVPKFGIVSTRHWVDWAGFDCQNCAPEGLESLEEISHDATPKLQGPLAVKFAELSVGGFSQDIPKSERKVVAQLISISLGSNTKDIAHGLFSALRELDKINVDTIYIEGIEDRGDIAAAVMNRLRKAASVIVK